MKKLSPYWICQLLGWGAIIPYWLYYQPLIDGFTIPILILLISVAIQIFFTDQYRSLAHRKKWIKRPLSTILPIVFLAWILLSLQYVIFNYSISCFRYGWKWNGDVLLGMVAGGTRYHAIWLLAFHLYHFAQRSAREAAKSAQFARLAAEAKLAKLQTELNPHFLFNALNSVKALTREDPARSRQAIDQLAELLRYSLRQSEREFVCLQEEIQIVKDYLQLEKIRFEERLQIIWTIEEDLLSFQLPPLSLHTLVENALKHGIALLPQGGTLSISGHKTATGWQLIVRNTGRYEIGKSPGTGIRNISQRLALLYGDAADFSIYNDADSVTAKLNFPNQVK